MLKPFKHVYLSLLLWAGVLIAAQAAPSYWVDPVNHLFYLTGSVQGNPGHIGPYKEARWSTDSFREEIPEGDQTKVDIDSSGNQTNGVDSVEAPVITINMHAYSVLMLHHILINAKTIFADMGTITFTNLRFDYSFFDEPNRNYVDSLANTQNTLLLTLGSGYGNIPYIPEPAYAGLFAGGALFMMLVARNIGKKRRLAA